jgi:serine/threonine protein kinase
VTDSLASPAEVLLKLCPLCGEELSADTLVCRCTAPDIPGLVFIQPVGSGGYADVFLYEQQMPRMPVAVKVLKVNLLSSEGLTQAIREQFTDEANTMAQLGDHPYIVQVFGTAITPDGRPYLVMKYYPPPNLALRAFNERFAVEDVLRIGIQLASAVETAHRAGITHRDIKPANVLVSQYGAPGLTDFGIARLGGGKIEHAEDVSVSVPWAAPEVLFGRSNGDQHSDIYSLAATLWQLLVGRSPFELPGADNTAHALMARIRSTPVPTTGRADVPTSLERLLAQAMSKDPFQRPASALDFARALQVVEQELRFARTAIVVLDEQGHKKLVSKAGSVASGLAPDVDVTRVRSPQWAYGQGPDEPATPQQSPAVVSGGPSPSTLTTSPPTMPPTTQTPAVRPLGAGADENTVRAVPHQADHLAPAQPTPASTGVRKALMLAVPVVLVLASVLGFVLYSGLRTPPNPLDVITVGGTDTAPTLTFKAKPLRVNAATIKVVTEGKGFKVTRDNSLILHYALFNGKDGKQVKSDFGDRLAGIPLWDHTKTHTGLAEALIGQRVGSRLLVAIPAGAFSDETNWGPGIGAGNTAVLFIELVSASTPLTTATGTAVAAKPGLPFMRGDGSEPTQLTIPKTPAPTEDIVQPLIKGAGAIVRAGQMVDVNVIMAQWKGAKPAERRGAVLLVGADDELGIDTFLIGRTVGSRVLLVGPPQDGSSEDTVVLVVDILGAN